MDLIEVSLAMYAEHTPPSVYIDLAWDVSNSDLYPICQLDKVVDASVRGLSVFVQFCCGVDYETAVAETLATFIRQVMDAPIEEVGLWLCLEQQGHPDYEERLDRIASLVIRSARPLAYAS